MSIMLVRPSRKSSVKNKTSVVECSKTCHAGILDILYEVPNASAAEFEIPSSERPFMIVYKALGEKQYT